MYGRSLLETLVAAARADVPPVAVRLTLGEISACSNALATMGMFNGVTTTIALGTKIAGLTVIATDKPVTERFIYADAS